MSLAEVNSMRWSAFVVSFVGMAWIPPAAADEALTIETAQLDCASFAPGPARTDCYIALSRIHQQDFEIAAAAARRSRDIARYHRVTGQHRNATSRATKQRW